MKPIGWEKGKDIYHAKYYGRGRGWPLWGKISKRKSGPPENTLYTKVPLCMTLNSPDQAQGKRIIGVLQSGEVPFFGQIRIQGSRTLRDV